MTDKAIIIKGPTQDAKSYFTGLPGTLDELVQKATKLFPVPPGHTPHLLLSNDAILMPDVLPFLKEREVLTFKWTANTPRSSLKQTSRTTEELLQQVNSSGSSSSGSYDRASRGVRWDASVVAKEISDSTPTIVPARQYRYSATARAEHSRRVLNEQEQEKKRVAATNSTKEGKTFANDDPFKVTSKNQDDPNTSPQTIQHEEKQNTTNEVTKSKIQISSPSMERERIQSDEEQPNSSPIASPTRNIRNAQKSSKEWMTPLGSDKCEEKLLKIGESNNGMSDKQVDETPKLQAQTNTPPTQNFVANSTSDNETSPSSQESPRTQAYYQQMTSIIDSLRSHPSNQFFRQSLEFDPRYSQYIQFLRENNRPVIDFHILGQKLQRRQYGQENVYAAFASDLSQMWSGIRAFFGPGSAHAQCAEFLERFSKIFMVEWRREGQVEDSRGRVKSTQKQSDSIVNPNAKAEAMARAAKLLQNMTYGSGANNNKTAMPQLKRKVSDSKMMTNNNAVQNRPRPIAGRPMINGQQKTQTSPLRNVKASAITMNASEKSFTPRTNAFLDSMFPKSHEVQNNTAPTAMMNKFSQAFKSNQGEIDSQRNSNSPKSSPKNKKEVKQTLSTALKRTEPESQLSQAEERPSKRIHADSNTQNVIVESNHVVPTVLVTEENQDADKMVVDVKTATLPVEKEEENAIEEVTKVIPSKTKEKRNLTSPNSGSAKKKNSQIIQQTRSSPRYTTIENIKESSEPRRSSRQSTPTTKVRNEEGIQTPNTQSPTNSVQEKSTPSRTRSRKSKSPSSSAEKQQQSQRKTSRASLLASMTNKPVTRQRRISANV